MEIQRIRLIRFTWPGENSILYDFFFFITYLHFLDIISCANTI